MSRGRSTQMCRRRLVSMAVTYILKSEKDGSYYIGAARILEKRLYKHRNGNVRSTKNKRPLKLVYVEHYESYSEANNREKQIKSWKKRRAIEDLIKRFGPVV